MKKLLSISLMAAMAFSIVGANAATSTFKSTLKDIKTSVKNDVKTTKSTLKDAVKSDVSNAKSQATSTAATKKAEKIKTIDNKISSLNSQISTIKKRTDITETEKSLKIAPLQKQVEYYKKQKAALN